MKTTLILALTLTSSYSAIFDATGLSYIDSSNADSNYNSAGYFTAASNSTRDRILVATFDSSSYAQPLSDVESISLNLTTFGGATGNGYEFYYVDEVVDLSSITWNTAVTDGYVSSVGAGIQSGSLIGSNSDSLAPNVTYTFDVSTSQILADSDQSFTVFVVNTGGAGNHFTEASVTVVPEPSSVLLAGLSGLAFIARRKRA